MDIIKQIINCETNTKFVKVIEGRYIEIPDVIFYVLYESGYTDVEGCHLGDGYPHIGGEIDHDGVRLLGFLNGDLIDNYFNFLVGEVWEDALGSVKAFVKKARRKLPHLYIDESVDEWLKEH